MLRPRKLELDVGSVVILDIGELAFELVSFSSETSGITVATVLGLSGGESSFSLSALCAARLGIRILREISSQLALTANGSQIPELLSGSG